MRIPRVNAAFPAGAGALKAPGLLLGIAVLLGCADKDEAPAPLAEIDREKIERIAFDFHFSFFDENLEPIELTTEEAAYFYDLKAKGEVQVGEPIGRGKQDEAGGNAPPEGGRAGEPPSRAYNKKCRKADVPIPPPFAKPTWTEIGSLSKDQIFADARFNPLYIWRYKPKVAPAGLCAATVRYQVGKPQDKNDKAANVQVVGVICQGKKSGNACFWASEKVPFGKKIEDFELNGDTIPTYTTFTNQDRTKGTKPLKCTFCHLGSNAFIVHPGTVLDGTGVGKAEDEDKGIAEEPDKRYTPISKRNADNTNDGDKWGNPPWKGADVIAPNDCRGCHAFAEVNNVWCRDVLQKAIGKTMPPPDGGETTEQRLPKFRPSLDILKAQCAKVGYELKF